MQIANICLAGLLIGMVAGQLIRALRPYGWLIFIIALLCVPIIAYGVCFGGTMGRLL